GRPTAAPTAPPNGSIRARYAALRRSASRLGSGVRHRRTRSRVRPSDATARPRWPLGRQQAIAPDARAAETGPRADWRRSADRRMPAPATIAADADLTRPRVDARPLDAALRLSRRCGRPSPGRRGPLGPR